MIRLNCFFGILLGFFNFFSCNEKIVYKINTGVFIESSEILDSICSTRKSSQKNFWVYDWNNVRSNKLRLDSVACLSLLRSDRSKDLFFSFYRKSNMTNDSMLRIYPKILDRYSASNDWVAYYHSWDSCKLYRKLLLPNEYESTLINCCSNDAVRY